VIEQWRQHYKRVNLAWVNTKWRIDRTASSAGHRQFLKEAERGRAGY